MSTPFHPPTVDEPPAHVPGAVAALVLGILSLVICPLCGPVAWSVGRKAEREVDASGGRLAGRGQATAGKILGIIGTIFLILLAGFLILGFALNSADAGVTG